MTWKRSEIQKENYAVLRLGSEFFRKTTWKYLFRKSTLSSFKEDIAKCINPFEFLHHPHVRGKTIVSFFVINSIMMMYQQFFMLHRSVPLLYIYFFPRFVEGRVFEIEIIQTPQIHEETPRLVDSATRNNDPPRILSSESRNVAGCLFSYLPHAHVYVKYILSRLK